MSDRGVREQSMSRPYALSLPLSFSHQAHGKGAFTTSTLSTRTNSKDRFALQGGSWKINSSLGDRELSSAAGREREQERTARSMRQQWRPDELVLTPVLLE
jgi:hypothetical protein